MRDLINIVTEAEVKPGERKPISFKVNRLDKMLKQLNKHKKNADALMSMDLPDTAKADLENVIKKLNTEIEKVQSVYDEAAAKLDKSADRPIKVQNFFNGLLKNCKQILSIYKELNQSDKATDARFLFRGIRGQSSDALYGKPYTNRKPKDSPHEADQMFNAALKAAGFEARRDNSTFVSGNDSHAGGYGNLYIIFPVDGFDFTWSKKFDDLVLPGNYVKAGMIDKEGAKKLKNMLSLKDQRFLDSLSWNYNVEHPKYWKKASDIADNVAKLKKALNAGFLPEDFGPLLDAALNPDALAKSLDTYQLKNTDLIAAIMSNHEIYISGPYYAIKDTDKNRKYLLKFLESSSLSGEDFHPEAGEMINRLTMGEVVQLPDGSLGTVSDWHGDTTEVQVSLKTGLKNVSFPTKDLTVVQHPMVDEGDVVYNTRTKQLGKVTQAHSGLSIYVRTPNSWSSVKFPAHELVKIDPSVFKFSPGDKVIVTQPGNYYDNVYGKVGIVKKALKSYVVAELITKTGKPTGKSVEFHPTEFIPLNSDIARLTFPKLVAAMLPAGEPDKEPSPSNAAVDELVSSAKNGVVTYVDIDRVLAKHMPAFTDADLSNVINLVKQQGMTVKPV